MTTATFRTTQAPSVARRAVLVAFNIAVNLAVVVLLLVAVVRTALGPRSA